jgi:hypothetical protein
MVKKCFLVLLLLIICGSSSIWADHMLGYTIGIPLASLGGGLLAANYIIPEEPDSLTTGICALLLTGGLVWFFLDLFTHPTDYAMNPSSSGEIPSIVNHISFGVLPNKVYIGAKFKF